MLRIAGPGQGSPSQADEMDVPTPIAQVCGEGRQRRQYRGRSRRIDHQSHLPSRTARPYGHNRREVADAAIQVARHRDAASVPVDLRRAPPAVLAASPRVRDDLVEPKQCTACVGARLGRITRDAKLEIEPDFVEGLAWLAAELQRSRN